MQTVPMVLRKALVHPDATVVVPIGTAGAARPHRKQPDRWVFRTYVDGAPRAFVVPADALEAPPEAKRVRRRDDLVLPDPEPVPIAALLREVASERGSAEDSRALPFAVVAVGVLVVLLALGVG